MKTWGAAAEVFEGRGPWGRGMGLRSGGVVEAKELWQEHARDSQGRQEGRQSQKGLREAK